MWGIFPIEKSRPFSIHQQPFCLLRSAFWVQHNEQILVVRDGLIALNFFLPSEECRNNGRWTAHPPQWATPKKHPFGKKRFCTSYIVLLKQNITNKLCYRQKLKKTPNMCCSSFSERWHEKREEKTLKGVLFNVFYINLYNKKFASWFLHFLIKTNKSTGIN